MRNVEFERSGVAVEKIAAGGAEREKQDGY
jgi:hypothetical protein